MKTSDLIKALSVDARPAQPLGRTWLAAAAIATAIAAVMFFGTIGPRPDIAAAAQTVRFPMKFVVTIALAASAFAVLRELSRPGEEPRWTWLLPAPLLLGLAVAAEFLAIPRDQLVARLVGNNMLVCLTFIPLIGLGPLAVFLAALRHGAPTRPLIAGAIAGLAAGGLAATFYAAHCTDDSPLFVATWYTIAVAVLAALGAVLAPHIARW